jgi:hypothetical protein
MLTTSGFDKLVNNKAQRQADALYFMFCMKGSFAFRFRNHTQNPRQLVYPPHPDTDTRRAGWLCRPMKWQGWVRWPSVSCMLQKSRLAHQNILRRSDTRTVVRLSQKEGFARGCLVRE